MRIIVFFDLPTETALDRRKYGKFRRNLIKNGFMMMQASVYIKLALNQTNAALVIENIKKYRPPKGLIQVLTITEKQFQKMEFIIGDFRGNIVNSDERLLII